VGNVTVDAVYTWVDGNCPRYQALCRQYARNAEDLNPERFRDLYTMLKYSLRSLETYAPWVRNVYLVTCRPQVPAWLQTASPRVRVVHHDEIFDSAGYLPTFNANVIESYLHRVPSDASYLLYLNDDYLFGRETSLADFLTADGRIKVYGTFFGETFEGRIYKRGFIKSMGFAEHNPLLIHRAAWEAMLASRPEELHRTRMQRFRSDDDLWPDKWYRYFLLTQRSIRTKAVPALQALRFNRLHKIKNDPGRQRRELARLARMRPRFYCMNDDQGPDPDPEVTTAVRAFLDAYYPRPSCFER
jgi:hypothetical protein